MALFGRTRSCGGSPDSSGREYRDVVDVTAVSSPAVFAPLPVEAVPLDLVFAIESTRIKYSNYACASPIVSLERFPRCEVLPTVLWLCIYLPGYARKEGCLLQIKRVNVASHLSETRLSILYPR